MRKIFMIGLVSAFVVSAVATAVATDGKLVARGITAYYGNISVKVNGQVVKTDVEPFIVDGRTFVPLRAVGEALGMDVAWDQGKNQVVINSKPNAADNAQAAGGKPANQVLPELAFERILWINGAPTAPAGSGVWVYTKAAHPGQLDDTVSWDRQDLLLVQFPKERYPGHELKVMALQPIGADTVRIVCRLSPPRPDVSADKQRLPREYLVVKAGALAGKQFVLVDEAFKELATD